MRARAAVLILGLGDAVDRGIQEEVSAFRDVHAALLDICPCSSLEVYGL